ncbi:MAG: GNAT family N-acetyltransferase [Synergistaceae bacterium]|nr:GNAT family N-acetyltransferase [Synergistaceae bacterium]
MQNIKEQNTCNDEIRLVPVTPEYPHIERLLDIRDEAFPPNERIDSRDISNYTEENGWFFLAIENQNEPVGFTLWYDCGDNMLFGLYIAIAHEFQNKHYGARTFNLLMDKYFKGKILFGCTEALLPETDNYQQRLNRIRFHKRNRLFLHDEIIDGGPFGKYQFVCSDPSVSHEQLLEKFCEFMPPSLLANLKK